MFNEQLVGNITEIVQLKNKMEENQNSFSDIRAEISNIQETMVNVKENV